MTLTVPARSKVNRPVRTGQILDWISFLTSLFWVMSLPLKTTYRPVFLYALAAVSFVCYTASRALAVERPDWPKNTAQLFGTSLILIGGLFDVTEAHNIVQTRLHSAFAIIIVLDGLLAIAVITLLSTAISHISIPHVWGRVYGTYRRVLSDDRSHSRTPDNNE